jgi:hypothetical protein
MPMHFRRWIPLAAVLVGWASTGVHAQGKDVRDVLHAAAEYLVQYSQQLAAVAAEEEYRQSDTSTGEMRSTRRLNTDFVLLGLGDGGVAGFRDVFGIDSAPVRQRDDRLLAIFKSPSSSSLQQARALSDGSVRHYLSVNLRAFDQPSIALEFLRRENQERSVFKVESVKTMDGARVAILKFNERSLPRIVPSPDDAPALGRFWIDVETGAVRQTELAMAGKAASLRASVRYANDPALGLWLPAEMSQQVEVTGTGSGEPTVMGAGGGYATRRSLEGRASYSKFRRTPVDLSKIQ